MSARQRCSVLRGAALAGAMQPDEGQKRGWKYEPKLQAGHFCQFATENGFWLIFLQNILFTKYYLCNFKALLPSLKRSATD